MLETNLCIIGLAKDFTDQLCKKLSARLDMFYANVEEFVDYNLEAEEMKKICGIEYFKNKQINEIRKICRYENTMLNINYTLLNDKVIFDIIKSSCVIIYLQLDLERINIEFRKEKRTPNEINIINTMYNDRDFLCKSKAHITIPFDKSDDEIIELIASTIENE
jgi:shikimate kinase